MTEPTGLLEGLTKPATVLIERICDAVGCVFEPTQIKRIAAAQAEADKIAAVAAIEVAEMKTVAKARLELKYRAIKRWAEEETKKQENIESITVQALPQLDEAKAQPEKLEPDWITNFFDKCRLISDQDMQALWAKVLAGEANSPGKYSKRTVNFLGSLDKEDGALFAKLCGFAWQFGPDLVPLVFDTANSIYQTQGITLPALTHLSDIGLISYLGIGHYSRGAFPRRCGFLYFGIPTMLEFSHDDGDSKNSLETGSVMLSKIGQELSPLCGASPVAGFREYVVERWSKAGIKVLSVVDFGTSQTTT